MIAVSDLIVSATADEIFEQFLSNLETLKIPARTWREGGVARSILRVVAIAYAGFSAFIAAFIRSGFLETSDESWLTLLARYVYGVERIAATFATGEATFTNSGGAIYNFAAREVSIIRTVSGVTYAYTNVDAFTLNPGDVLTIDVIAIVSGASSSAPSNTLTTLETVLPGVTVNNAAAVVGTDEQADADLRQLCLDRLASLSPAGARGAYSYAVRSAKRLDGSPVNLNRVAISASSSTGIVSIYVAAPSGAPDPADITAARENCETVRPDSVTVNLAAATSVAFTRTIIVWAKRTPGLDAAGLSDLVGAKLVELQRTYPIGGLKKPPSTQGYLYADGVAGAVQAAHPAIFDVDLNNTADMALAAGEIATLTTTLDVRIVESPE
jgi:hypothetical protein